MTPKLEKVEYLSDYKIRLSFSDDTVGEVDFADELWGEVFEPLRQLSVFRQFYLDPDLKTLVWPNGADFAPEFLYEEAIKHSVSR